MKSNFLFFISTIFLLVSCNQQYASKERLTDFIPLEAEIIFVFQDSKGVENDINSNAFSGLLSQTPEFETLLKNPFLEAFPLTTKSIIAVTKNKDSLSYLISSRLSSNASLLDAIRSKIIDSVKTGKGWLHKVQVNKQVVFTKVIDSFLVASNAQAHLISVLEGNTLQDPQVEKLASLHTEGNLQVLFENQSEIVQNTSKTLPKSWQGYSMQLPPESLQMLGVTFIKDSVPSSLWLLKGQQAQVHNTLTIIPLETTQSTSLSLSDTDLFFEKAQFFQPNLSAQEIAHFDSINEIAFCEMDGASALILESISPQVFLNAIPLSEITPSSYRDVSIYTGSEIAAQNTPLEVLFDISNLKTFFNIDSFFVFTENETAAQNIISSYLNKKVLSSHPQLNQKTNVLTNQTSLMHLYINSTKNKVLNTISPSITDYSKPIPFSSIQYTVEGNFAHINATLFDKKASLQNAANVIETQLISLNEPLLGSPLLFTNHRTKAKEIVLQDITNTLHLYSYTGKKLWSKNLDGPILGQIEEIDMLRNGKKQLAFVTATSFYILDRNGNAVAPFPIKFQDKVTQPLSVFDYDNNRKYRFVITQSDEVLMYDSKGKQVKGFTYSKAPASIVMPPQHFRIGNKDYITIASNKGKLDILSRTGKIRIPLSTSFNFGATPLQKEGNSFVVISEDNKKHSIATSGKISSLTLEVSPNYHFAVEGKTKVTLDDNLLRINGRLIELPFGLYSPPTILTHKGVTYISVTDTQEKKVYVYSNNNLLDGFPVYGTNSANMVGQEGKKLLLVQGDEKEILLYSF